MTDLTTAERQKAEKWLEHGWAPYAYPFHQLPTILALYARSCEREAVKKCLQLVKSSAAPSGVDFAIRREFASLLSEEKKA